MSDHLIKGNRHSEEKIEDLLILLEFNDKILEISEQIYVLCSSLNEVIFDKIYENCVI